MRALLRLVLFALVVALITAAIYLAVPYVYRYTMLPVQNNRVLLEHLQRTQAQLRDDVTGQLNAQRERIARLETGLADEQEARSELESRLAQHDEALAAQVDMNARLEALENRPDLRPELEAELEAQDEAIAELDERLAGLEEAVTRPEAGLNRLQQEILLLQMSQFVLKARIHLADNNPGQAQSELTQAQRLLRRLGQMAPPNRQDELDGIQAQLDEVAAAIEDRPFTALQELEILWQLLQEFSPG